MTFIIPSEAFPMHYHLTAQDISAASRKLGAIAAQLVDIGGKDKFMKHGHTEKCCYSQRNRVMTHMSIIVSNDVYILP